MARWLIGTTVLILIAVAAAAGAEELMVPVDGARLEARLIRPEGDGPFGAVIFIGGSSSGSFDGYAGGLNERLVEDVFLPRNYAILYYNKRGVGKSTGNWRWGSIERRARDTADIARYLSERPDIDPDRIGVVGHSQGGWVVQEIAGGDHDIEFAISLAGPVVSVSEQDLKRLEIDLSCSGHDETVVARRLRRLERNHRFKVWLGSWFPFFQLRLVHNIYPYDPAPALWRTTIPMLLAYAQFDNMAEPDQNRERLERIFPSGLPENIAWYLEPDADHLFRKTDNFCFDYLESLRSPVSASISEALGRWFDEAVRG